jgi:hypothetical protein
MGSKLFQQFTVDAWASIQQNLLNWTRHNQKKIRADVYQGLRDAVAGDADANINLAEHGQRIILPSSFIGSERHMQQLFQDSMAICRSFSKPDIFLTMTADPNWREIQENLFVWPNGQKQTVSDRPDIVVRVFEEKKNALLKEIKEGHVFGKVAAMVHTIEFQKRGLPHMHLLIFLDETCKIRSAKDVDDIVCAEFPDKDADPELFDIIGKAMVHGPCSARCLADPNNPNSKCTKKFPHPYQPETIYGEDGYPKYRRRDKGVQFVKGTNSYTNKYVSFAV